MMVKEHPILTIRKETLVDRLVQLLQESILSGKLAPEMRVSELSIAKEFGVSRVPAREALQRLEEMNLVRKTYRGREIMKFSSEEFRQIFELKVVVEAFGVMQGSLNATQQDFEKIEGILKQMEEEIPAADLDRGRDLDRNRAFHDSLVICSRNEILINTFLSLERQVHWAWTLPYVAGLQRDPEKRYRRHREIFDLFRQREAEKVRRLIETHFNETLKRILAQMEIKD